MTTGVGEDPPRTGAQTEGARQLRVAHVLPWPTIGGVEIATLRAALAVEGPEFTAVAFHLPEGKAVRDLFSAEGISTAEYSVAEHSVRHGAAYLRSARVLAQQFADYGIDIVHCSDLLAAFRAGVAGRLAGLPVICHVRCEFPFLSRRDRAFLAPVDRFVFVSRYGWEKFGHRVPPSRARVLYDGIDVPSAAALPGARDDVRAELGLPVDAPVVGMVARVAEAKDFLTLIGAAARLRPELPALRFVIVGDNSSTAAYREHFERVRGWVAAQGVGELFTFTGHRPDARRLLAGLDAFVLSTHGEGLPLALLEAMAVGLPVVATRVGGVPELVQDGQTGLLYERASVEGLVDRLRLVLTEPELARSLGCAARASVGGRFSWERFSIELRALYRETLRDLPPRKHALLSGISYLVAR